MLYLKSSQAKHVLCCCWCQPCLRLPIGVVIGGDGISGGGIRGITGGDSSAARTHDLLLFHSCAPNPGIYCVDGSYGGYRLLMLLVVTATRESRRVMGGHSINQAHLTANAPATSLMVRFTTSLYTLFQVI